jgi:hypothetical protein
VKLGGLLDSAGGDLGTRINLVGILPMTVLVLSALALVWSGAPSVEPDLLAIASQLSKFETMDTLSLALSVTVLVLVLHPLQLPLVRVLEGYWGTLPGVAALASWRSEHHRRRLEKVSAAFTSAARAATAGASSDVSEARAQAAASELMYFYPSPDRVLPTALGNALRAAEDKPAQRYGLDAVVVWPRLHPLLSERLAATLDDQRNQLDLAARFSVTFGALVVLSAAFLWKYPAWLVVSFDAAVLSWLSYRVAVSVAVRYGESIVAAFDLHRFDLLEALHLPLPKNRADEVEANAKLSEFLRQGMDPGFEYAEPRESKEG